ncbi:MAG: NAD(P)/FAD-dependent oxidoreductase [Granulosicoccus sp.]
MLRNSKKRIAVIGSGAAGLSAAWLLAKAHDVVLLEKENRLGGHAHTAIVTPAMQAEHRDPRQPKLPGDNYPVSCDINIDTGFIVYNEPCYPNLTRWFDHLNVGTEASDMSFAVSRDNGAFEYAGGPALGLIAQRNLPFKPRFWRMLKDLIRFYRHARQQIGNNSNLSLGEFLKLHSYCEEFIQDHLLPFGSAIWSTSKAKMLDYPALSFIQFCDNHGLLQLTGRPQWRTVTGGSQAYVSAVYDAIGPDSVITDFEVAGVVRKDDCVEITDMQGHKVQADEIVIATHADQALQMLASPSPEERALLSVFSYEYNQAYLHTDRAFMPKRRRAWCSWNYVEQDSQSASQVSVSYWMNRLQNIDSGNDYIVTLNPVVPPAKNCVLRKSGYEHPVFTAETLASQRSLWSLQGCQRTWFCGSYFGAGFHEDAVQSGFAVAEQLGELQRPWHLENPSARICTDDALNPRRLQVDGAPA